MASDTINLNSVEAFRGSSKVAGSRVPGGMGEDHISFNPGLTIEYKGNIVFPSAPRAHRRHYYNSYTYMNIIVMAPPGLRRNRQNICIFLE